MNRNLRALLALALLGGCDETGPVDLNLSDAVVVRPDSGGGGAGGAGGGADRGPDDDARVQDASVDASADMAGLDMGDAVVDMALPVDMGPPGAPPPRDRVVVLSNRDDAWIAWVKGGRLWAARLRENAEAVEEPVDLADASGLEGPLVGYRLAGNRPWVLLPDGEGGMLQAHDLTGQSGPAPLGIWPPARVSVDGEALVMGRASAAPDAPAAWRLIGDRNALNTLQVDRFGVPPPRTAARALDGWVFGFDRVDGGDGETCLDLTVSGATQGSWACHGATDARLVGAGTQLDWVGTTAAGLTAWLAVPGSSPGPDGEDDPALRTTLAPGAAVVAWLSPPPTGQLAHVLEADGADALWWIRHDRARRLAAPEAPTVFGLTEVKSDRRLISWSEELNRPIPLPAVFEDGPVPPRWVAPNECSGVAAEMCAGQDEDCDGAASDGLCCRDTVGGLSTAVMANDELTRDWFAGFSDEGILLAVRQGTRLRLLSHPAGDISGREARELVGYDGIHQVGFFSNQLARAVMLVDRDVPDAEPPAEGEPVPTEKRLLWFLGQVGSRDAAPPCAEVLGLRMLDNTGRTRVWCTDGAHDMNPVDGMTSAVFYPGEGGDLHWWEPNALGLADHYLVARGDDYTLQLWRRELDGTLSVSDEALPPEVALLTPEERVVPMRLPVQAGGPTARVRDGRFLEIVVPGFGWQRVPGSAWPQEARISRYDPVAVTVGFLEDPAGQDPALLQLGYILHSLQPGTPTWGVQFNPDRPNNVQGADQQGVEFGDYASGAFARPIFVTAIGQIRGGAGVVTFNATRIGCEAPR